MSPIVFLVLPVVLSLVGCLVVGVLAKQSRTVQSDVDAFRRTMETLAQGARQASSSSPMPAVVKAETPGNPRSIRR